MDFNRARKQGCIHIENAVFCLLFKHSIDTFYVTPISSKEFSFSKPYFSTKEHIEKEFEKISGKKLVLNK